MRREDDPIAIMLIDLDNFKHINDRYGYMEAVGLLKEVAKRLQTSIREDDVATRIGGDEFVILLRNIKSEREVFDVAEKIVKRVNEPYQIHQGEEVNQKLSIGAALLKDPSNLTLEAFLKVADISIYRLKALGKNGFYLNDDCFFQVSI